MSRGYRGDDGRALLVLRARTPRPQRPVVPHRHARRHDDGARHPACVASMFVWALEGPEHEVLGKLILLPDEGARRSDLADRHVAVANEPDIWLVITLAIFWYFGTEVERLLGRSPLRRAARCLVTVIPGHRRHRSIDLPQCGHPPGRARACSWCSSPSTRSSVLLRHPGVGDRRRHPRHRGPPVLGDRDEKRHPVPVRRRSPSRRSRRARWACSSNSRGSRRCRSALGSGRRSNGHVEASRQPRAWRRRGRRRAVVDRDPHRPDAGRCRSPTAAGVRRRRPGRARRPARQDLGAAWTGSPPTRSAASTSSPSGCAAAERHPQATIRLPVISSISSGDGNGCRRGRPRPRRPITTSPSCSC